MKDEKNEKNRLIFPRLIKVSVISVSLTKGGSQCSSVGKWFNSLLRLFYCEVFPYPMYRWLF